MKIHKRNRYPVGAIIGQAYGMINSIAQPMRDRAEEVDPITGEYLDYRKAYSTARAGSLLDPSRIFSDQDATTGEKVMSGIGLALGGVGIGSNFQKKIYARKEERLKNEAFQQLHPNTTGPSYNPYYMARGGRIGEMAELEDGEVFQTPGGPIESVDGATHAQGGELYNLPEGTAILGKNVSKEYQKKFKDLGQRLKTMQDKHTKVMDSNEPLISKRTSKLMLNKIQNQYDQLVSEQEMEKGNEIPEDYAKGGIHIKPSHRGRFTAYKKRTGKTTEEALHSKDPRVRKMANFARMAKRHFKKMAEGGYIVGREYDLPREEVKRLQSLGYEFE